MSLEHYSTLLEKYYDCNVLNNLNEEKGTKILHQLFNKYKETNKTLATLIKNYAGEPKKPIYDNISGPFSLSIHTSKEFKKTIYVFGESHGYEFGCDLLQPTITKYLSELFKNTDVFIDFFIEDGKIYNEFDENWYIIKLQSFFRDCVDQNQKCKFPLIRAHYTDMRNEHTNDMVNLMFKISTNTYNKSIELTKEIHKGLLKILEFNSYEKFILHLYDTTLTPTIKKEIQKSNLDSEMFYIYMEQNFESMIDENKFNSLKTNMVKYMSKNRTDRHVILSLQILNVITEFVLHMMDVYLLARIFKTFKNSGRNQPDGVYNAVIYTGNEHADNYRLFLESLDFITVNSIDSSEKDKIVRCLNMKNIQQPFFSKLY